MGRNVGSLLAVGLIVSLPHIAPVRSQCTTTFCIDDDTDVSALSAMLYRLQDTLERQQDTIRRQQDTIRRQQDTLELQQKQLMRHEDILAKLQTSVATTAKPTTAAPAPTCEFVKSENKHGFGGKEKKEAKTVGDCKQTCLAMTGCAGFDFYNNDNSCWLLDAAHVELIVDSTGVDHYNMAEYCKATTIR